MIGHPGEARLLGFQDGSLGDRGRRRIARHLADCQACRNIVQDHRGVRAALQLEAPAAPAGVLERALATREGGTVIMLPVADPDLGGARQESSGGARYRWSWRRPRFRTPSGLGASLLRIGALAGATAAIGIVVMNVVASTPVFSLGISDARWAAFKQGIIDFDPLGAGTIGSFQMGWSFQRPLGAPAVLHPERLKPFTAVYASTQSRFESPDAAPELHRYPDEIYQLQPAATGGSLLLDIQSGAGWESLSHLELSAATLQPHRWTYSRHRSGGDGGGGVYAFDAVTTYTIVPDGGRLHTVVATENVVGEIPTRILAQLPVTEWRAIRETAAPIHIGGEGHLMLMFQAIPLSKGWRGSFEPWRSMLAGNDPSWPEPSVWWQRSYEVEGSEVVSVPAGSYDAWVVRSYTARGPYGSTYYLRKADGLLLRVTSGWDATTSTPSYPRTSTTMELQSITYP